jgi:SAM-dependent methyltransferase
MNALLETESILPHGQRVTFFTCPDCGTIFQIDFLPADYTDPDIGTRALKFYLEQGAGLESLAMPAFIAHHRLVQKYLEVGCGFGFGPDFARHTFGWKVRGIDPGSMAQEGRKLLGLDIESRYLSWDDAKTLGTQDAIAAVEVLEHIERPYDFLGILKANLAPEGLLIVTTPDAAYIEFGHDKPSLLSVLTPGYHAVLYTAESLALALSRSGFTETQVQPRGATLFAVAGPGASAIDIEGAFDPAQYRTYLETRLSTVEPMSALEVGLTYRLLKHLVNGGLYPAAEPVLRRLAKILRDRDGIDIQDPHGLLPSAAQPRSFEDFVTRFPACIVGVLYFSAMLKLNYHEDRSAAAAFFYTAHVVARVFHQAMRDFGIDDGETNDLERSSREHLNLVLGWMSN